MNTRTSPRARCSPRVAPVLALALLANSVANSQDLDPRLLGDWTLPGATDSDRVEHLVVSGRHAYLAGQGGNAAGLHIVDISDAALPFRIAHHRTGDAFRVAVRDNLACITTLGTGLDFIDVTNPARPVALGQYHFAAPGEVRVTLAGALAFLAAREGLLVLDVSDPRDPRLLTAYPIEGGARDVAVSGHHAYVTGGSEFPEHMDTVTVLDISDPSTPVRVGAYRNGPGGLVEVRNNLCIIGRTQCGTVILDVGDPAVPRELSCLAGGFVQQSLAVEDHLLLLGNSHTGLDIISIVDPASPRRVGRFPVRGPLAVKGHKGYARRFDGFSVIDLTRTATLSRVSDLEFGEDPNLVGFAVTASGERVLVHRPSLGLIIVDVRDPTEPKAVGSYAHGPGSAQLYATHVAGTYAWLARGDGLEVIDIQNVANPIRIGWHAISAAIPIDIAAVRDYIYVLAVSQDSREGFLQAFDAVDAANPKPAGRVETGIDSRIARVAGNRAYVAGFEGLRVIDISNPDHLVVLGEYRSRRPTVDVAESGDYAYLVSSGGVEILDLADVSNPVLVGFSEVGQGRDPDLLSIWPARIAVSDGFLYVATYFGVEVLDVRRPTHPQRVSGTTAFSASSVFVQGDHVYVGGHDGLIILNKYSELRIGPASVFSDGRVQLQLSGANGQCVRVQRSANLIDWEDWQTVTLDGTGCELIDETAASGQRFYRAVEDNSMAVR